MDFITDGYEKPIHVVGERLMKSNFVMLNFVQPDLKFGGRGRKIDL